MCNHTTEVSLIHMVKCILHRRRLCIDLYTLRNKVAIAHLKWCAKPVSLSTPESTVLSTLPTWSVLSTFHQENVDCLLYVASFPNVVEVLVKLVRRMMSGGRLEAWHFQWTAALCMHSTNKPCLQTSTWRHSMYEFYQDFHRVRW